MKKTSVLSICLVACCLLCVGLVAAQELSTDVKRTVAECFSYSPHLKSLQSEHLAVAQEFRSEWGGYLPSLDVSGGAGIEQHDATTTRLSDDDNDWDRRIEASATLTQLIFDHGQIKLIDRSRNRLYGAEKTLFEGAEALALSAINAHVSVVRQRELVALAEANLVTHQEIVDMLDERRAMGGGTRADVSQAKGRMYLAQSVLVEQRQKLQDAIALYENLVGHLPMELIDPDVPLLEVGDLETLLAKIETENPQIQAKMTDVEVADDTVGVATSEYFPNLYIEGKTSYEDQVEAATDYSQTTYVMVKSEWNLFNGGSDEANRQAALERRAKARQELASLHDAIVEDTKSSWALYHASVDNIENYSNAVQANTETRDMYVMQFQVGQRSLLDVLDAENELFTSSGRLVTSRANAVTSGYRLYALQGELMLAMDIAPSQYKNSTEEE